jgi:pectin methylesterase-like acyl-CoA thioesterase
MIVTPYGYGEYATVQSAIEAVPVNNSSPVTIELLPGTYT